MSGGASWPADFAMVSRRMACGTTTACARGSRSCARRISRRSRTSTRTWSGCAPGGTTAVAGRGRAAHGTGTGSAGGSVGGSSGLHPPRKFYIWTFRVLLQGLSLTLHHSLSFRDSASRSDPRTRTRFKAPEGATGFQAVPGDTKMTVDPTTMKYLISARLETDGIVEKPDVVGAIFGQTEGLLGEELDLRDLQKSGRIGRIEVEIDSRRGRGAGLVYIPSSLDQVETSIMAAALETVDRIGPCKAQIKVEKVEDVRVTKRNKIIERAKQLLGAMLEGSKATGVDLLDEVRASVQVSEIGSFGPERLPAGPNVADSEAILIVEGRQDVLNLLRSGIRNAVAVEGTNVPKSVQDQI